VGHASAHHARVAGHGDGVQVAAVEDVEIGLVELGVVGVDAGLVAVEGVGVLHRKLAHADQPGAGPRLVAELGLDLVEHHRQLAVAADELGRQLRHDLLMGHAQAHVATVAVLEARHVAADLVPAAAALPDLGGVHHGQGDFLAADRVHLLADDVLDLVFDALRQRQDVEDAGGDLVDHAGAQHQLVADGVGVGGHFTERLEKHSGHAHKQFSRSLSQ
jgi:hypothetical protein